MSFHESNLPLTVWFSDVARWGLPRTPRYTPWERDQEGPMSAKVTSCQLLPLDKVYLGQFYLATV